MLRWIVACTLFPLALSASELKPWFGKDKLIEITPFYTYGYYPNIDVEGKTLSQKTHNHTLGADLSFSPDPAWSLNADIKSFATTHTPYSFEDISITGRTLLSNDIVADPLSIALGITITKASTNSRKDISTFHPGEMNYEFHLAFGKECICEQFWTSRYWGLVGMGIANRGSPWLKAIAGFDINHWDCYSYGMYLTALYGLGSHPLDIDQFHGYGSVQFRSIDLNFFIKKQSNLGEFFLFYTVRPWAYNFPTHLNAVTLALTIPYNL